MTAVTDPGNTADLLAQPLALLEERFAERRIALAGGAQLAVRCAGDADAPAIVLLHGIGSGAGSWLHTALALTAADAAPAAARRVIAWDAPGYGHSTPLTQARPLATDYAARLADGLDALGITACVLVGHSLGALTAAAFAHGLGRRIVRRLVLISPARGYGAPEQVEARAQARHTRLETLRTRGIDGIAAQAPSRMLSTAASAAARAWVQRNAARLHPAGYAQAVEMLCGDDLARYAALAAPVEVHVGDADVVTSPDACRSVAERFGAPFSLIMSAGHASPIEQPDAVAQRIARAASQEFA